MEDQNHAYTSAIVENIDPYSMLMDVLKNLWVVLLGALAVAMIVNMISRANYESTYTTNTTFVVSSQNANSSTYSNLNAAQSMANSFTNILNSDILKKKVCLDLGLETFDATTTATAIENTNLLTLTVTADSPQKTYDIIRSIMNNYNDLTQYVSGNMVMQVLQPPQVPTGVDVDFNANRMTLRGFLLAFLFFVFCFVVLSYQKGTIRSQKDMEDNLAARSLGMIYYEKKHRGLFRRKRDSSLLVSHAVVGFEFVERFKKIAAMIVNLARKSSAQTIVVTSVKEGEGKSTVAANLALTLAKQDYRVVLLDADLRSPSLYRILGKKEKDGGSLGELLEGKTEVSKALQYDRDNRMYMILNHRHYTNSTDIVSSDAMKKTLEALKKVVDYIIIDTPPMSGLADAEAIANFADMSLLVVGYDRVYAEDLNDAIDSLRDCQAEMAGCILNQVKTLPGSRRTVGGYGGYGRYGHYGHYGYYGYYSHYGHYGRYGRYGKYGSYGHYGSDRQGEREEHSAGNEKRMDRKEEPKQNELFTGSDQTGINSRRRKAE